MWKQYRVIRRVVTWVEVSCRPECPIRYLLNASIMSRSRSRRNAPRLLIKRSAILVLDHKLRRPEPTPATGPIQPSSFRNDLLWYTHFNNHFCAKSMSGRRRQRSTKCRDRDFESDSDEHSDSEQDNHPPVSTQQPFPLSYQSD